MKPWKWDLYGQQMLLQVQENNNSRFNVIILIELLQGGHKITLYLHKKIHFNILLYCTEAAACDLWLICALASVIFSSGFNHRANKFNNVNKLMKYSLSSRHRFDSIHHLCIRSMMLCLITPMFSKDGV